MERRVKVAKAYLGESAFVQKTSLEPRDSQRGYAARASPPGVPEKAASRRGQARSLRETALRPGTRANYRPSKEASGFVLTDLTPARMRLVSEGVSGEACRRLEKMVRVHDR